MIQDQQYLIIIAPRQSGKTTQMIDAMKKDELSVLLVSDNKAKMSTIQDFKLPVNKVLTWDELTSETYGRGVRNVYIDNVDILLRRLLGQFEIKAISMTGSALSPIKKTVTKSKKK